MTPRDDYRSWTYYVDETGAQCVDEVVYGVQPPGEEEDFNGPGELECVICGDDKIALVFDQDHVPDRRVAIAHRSALCKTCGSVADARSSSVAGQRHMTYLEWHRCKHRVDAGTNVLRQQLGDGQQENETAVVARDFDPAYWGHQMVGAKLVHVRAQVASPVVFHRANIRPTMPLSERATLWSGNYTSE